MYYEAARQYDRAAEVYKAVLDKEPSHEGMAKRMVRGTGGRGEVEGEWRGAGKGGW
jgi:hypothetical protein